MLPRSALLEIFRQNPRKPLSSRELVQRLELDFADRRTLRRMLRSLVDEGALVRKGGGTYALGSERSDVTGIVSFRANGNAEIATEDGQLVTVMARHLGGALPGDKVRAELLPMRDGVRRAAEVREIFEHGPGQILGVFRRAAKGGFIEPREPELFPYYLAITKGETAGAEDGDLVVASLHEPPRVPPVQSARAWTRAPSPGPSTSLPPIPTGPRVTGKVLEVLGHPSDPSVEIAAIAYHHGLSLEFPEDVLDEVAQTPMEVRPEDREGRVDMRHLPFVTIDGADARDFDDAVLVERQKGGGFLVRVAIADVSHYVRPGTALDREAVMRGTSCYFPDRVLPMLPHPLSNGVCSLKPDVERLALVAILHLDAKAKLVKSEFVEAVIKSHARLTYDEVFECIEAGKPLRGAGDPANLVAAQKALNERRRERGSIDFDIAEAKIVLDDDGDVADVARRERNLAHRIVEELMLAANEAVAAHFDRLDHPTVYRVHDQPDEEKLASFARLAASLGFQLRAADLDDPRSLARFVESLGDRPGARALHALLLRSMKQALYDVENIGHYGLAASEYLHFTSPIRRYPDLLVHRLLRDLLRDGAGAGKRGSQSRDDLVTQLADLAAQASMREREAMDAERETIAYYRARIMMRHVGEEFPGRIAGVAPFGLFVEIDEPFVDGLVHVQTLGDDYYEYSEETQRLVGRGTGRTLALGDKVTVRVDGVNVQRRQVSLQLVDGRGGDDRAGRRAQPPLTQRAEHERRVGRLRGVVPAGRENARKSAGGDAKKRGGERKRPAAASSSSRAPNKNERGTPRGGGGHKPRGGPKRR